MMRTSPLRVCLDARLQEGAWGGVQQTIIGLASGLSELEGDEEYLFLVNGEAEWLVPHLRGRCGLLRAAGGARSGWKRGVKALLPEPLVTAAYRKVSALRAPRVPASDGTIERAGVDVMHFTLQSGFRTSVPSIYVPHDLQHLHLPEMFTRHDLRWREAFYPALCAQAEHVVALSRWGKRDLVDSLGVQESKIRVIGWGPVVDSYPSPTDDDVAEVRKRRALPEAFALFPAQTFRHKNHLRLIDAVALLRERHGMRVNVVCTGYLNDHFPALDRRVRALGLGDQIRFLGFVTPLELQCLYRACRLLVFPSLFEGFGMPVLEAFRLGVPVACSDATNLPELAGGAALLFDPARAESIAGALSRIWGDADLRDSLAKSGRERARAFSWRKTALQYRALYRAVASRPLAGDDRDLLAEAG